VWWKKKEAKRFYHIHEGQPFFKDLVAFMTSGPIVLQVLEGEDAIARNREVMGATNPVDAAPGTIRKDFAVNLQRNSVHGSDSQETAKREIALCFKKSEITG
jgi:nucleoside-diphosphate kinase